MISGMGFPGEEQVWIVSEMILFDPRPAVQYFLPDVSGQRAHHMPKKGTGTRKACCSYRLQTPFQLVNWVKKTIST